MRVPMLLPGAVAVIFLAVAPDRGGAAWGAGDMAPGVSAPTAQPQQSAYLFVPGDVLDITVQPRPEYDRTVTVQPDGKIVFPVVGEIQAAGLNVQQLKERLEQGLLAELKRPRVTVSLKEISKGLLRRVSVLGAVRKIGRAHV